MPELEAETPVGRRGLGAWGSAPDERDEGYPAARAVSASLRAFSSASEARDRGWRYWWPSGWWGDQGRQPWCMAFGCLHLLADGPATHFGEDPTPFWEPRWAYCEMQRLDPWRGDCEDPRYDGASVRSGFKLLRREGLVDGYWWARDAWEVAEALIAVGPVGIGVGWTEGMLDTDGDGFVHPSGREVGGHFVVLNGANLEREEVRGKNSWGRSWGVNGAFRMTFAALEDRLAANGEAAVATFPGFPAAV